MKKFPLEITVTKHVFIQTGTCVILIAALGRLSFEWSKKPKKKQKTHHTLKKSIRIYTIRMIDDEQ